MPNKIGCSYGRFSLYTGDNLTFEHATFNHATGFIYRAQGFGNAAISVFEVQAALRDNGFARVGRCVAIFEPPTDS